MSITLTVIAKDEKKNDIALKYGLRAFGLTFFVFDFLDPVVQMPDSAHPGLYFNTSFFFFLSKHSLG